MQRSPKSATAFPSRRKLVIRPAKPASPTACSRVTATSRACADAWRRWSSASPAACRMLRLHQHRLHQHRLRQHRLRRARPLATLPGFAHRCLPGSSAASSQALSGDRLFSVRRWSPLSLTLGLPRLAAGAIVPRPHTAARPAQASTGERHPHRHRGDDERKQ